MTDIVAQEVAAASPQVYLWAGGVFDLLFAGLPIYFWIIFLGALAFGGVLFWNWYSWNLISAVGGHHTAVMKNIPEALKITKNRNMKLMPSVYADQIFEWEDPKEIEKWHLTSPLVVGQLGPVNTAILVDYHDWVDDPILNESIKVACEKWNEENTDDQIHHYSKYMAYRTNGKLQEVSPNGVMVPAYFWVDWAAQEQYMPKQRDAASFGGFIRREAAKIKSGDNEKLSNSGAWVLGGSVALSIIMIIFAYLYSSSIINAIPK
jgi:hypothetical protein